MTTPPPPADESKKETAQEVGAVVLYGLGADGVRVYREATAFAVAPDHWWNSDPLTTREIQEAVRHAYLKGYGAALAAVGGKAKGPPR